MGFFIDHYIGCVLESATVNSIIKHIKYFWWVVNFNVNEGQQPETSGQNHVCNKAFFINLKNLAKL